MKKFSIVLAVCAWVLPLVVEAQADPPAAGQHSEHGDQAQSSAAPSGHSMHEHMQAMREQMAGIHATQDPEERQRLMHEHMQSMQEHMQMMGRMGSSGSDGARAGMRCAQGDLACRTDDLQSQHESMRQSMSEMRELMEQMMEHLRATAEEAEPR